MTIEQLRNIFGSQSEQRKMIDEWGQKRSFWLKVLRIDSLTAHNFFKNEIDECAKDISSFFQDSHNCIMHISRFHHITDDLSYLLSYFSKQYCINVDWLNCAGFGWRVYHLWIHFPNKRVTPT